MRVSALILMAALVGCSSGGGSHHSSPKPSPAPQTSGWSFGPVVNGKNFSEGVAAAPTLQGNGWTFAVPSTGGVDAVIKKSPPLTVGAKSVTLHYSVTGGGFLATGENSVAGRVGFSIQRRGDNWSGSGAYQQYRLFGKSRPLLKAGQATLTIQLTAGNLTDVGGKAASQAAIDAVLADLDNYSVVFGGTFASHGVYATQPSTFTLEEITVQ